MAADRVETFVEGLERLAAGDVDNAMDRWRRLASEDDGGNRVWLSSRLARAWLDVGKPGPARALCRSALERAETDDARAWLFEELAAAYQAESRFEEARAALESARDLRRSTRVDRDLLVAHTDLQLVRLDLAVGRLDEADARLRGIRRRIAARAADSYAWVDVLHQEGILAYSRGDAETAADLWRRAMDLEHRMHGTSETAARLANNLGAVAFASGDLAQAEEAFGRALDFHQRRSPGSSDVASSLSNLGAVAWERGQLDLARKRWQRTLELERALDPGSLGMAATLNNLGLLAIDLGALDVAERDLAEALDIYRALTPESLDVALVANNLSSLAYRRGDLEAAERHSRTALALQEVQSPDSLPLALTLAQLGDIVLGAGRIDEALSYLRRAEVVRETRARGSMAHALTLLSLGRAHRLAGRVEPSRQALGQAAALLRRLAPDSLAYAWVHHQLGLLRRQLGDTTGALASFRDGLRALEAQTRRIGGSYQLLARYREDHFYLYRQARDLLLELGRTAEAFEIEERARNRAFLDSTGQRVDQDPETRALARRYDQLYHHLFSLGDDAPDEQLALRDELAEIRRQYERSLPWNRDTAPDGTRPPRDLAALHRVLDDGTLFLTYVVEDDRVLVFAISSADEVTSVELDIDRGKLAAEVARLRTLIREGRPGSALARRRGQAARELAGRLYQRLFAGLESRIDTARRLSIAADGALHHLPWGALFDPTHDRYLIEAMPIHLVSSGSLWVELRSRPEPEAPLDLVAFGDPSYPTSGAADGVLAAAIERGLELGRLPQTRAEVLSIASLFGAGAVVHLGAEATEARVKAQAGQARFVHLAAHGFLDRSSSLDGAVVLSLPDSVDAGGENGLLQTWEVFEQLRLDAELVVLSACESALGRPMWGEGAIGLTRAFQYAGAHSVVASLWKVDDASTRDLMSELYRGLLRGESKDEALRSAQLRLLRGTAHTAPYYWAAFQLFGDRR